MVVMGHDGYVDAVPRPGRQRGRPDVAERVDAEQIEARRPVHAPDRRRQHHGRDRPAQPSPDRKAVDRPVRHAVRVALVPGEQDVEDDAARGHLTQHLDLVHLAAQPRLGIETAVRRAHAHGGAADAGRGRNRARRLHAPYRTSRVIAA